MPRNFDPEDIVGKRFGELTVVEYAGSKDVISVQTQRFYRCKCDCGNETVVRRDVLLSGSTRSCGCLRKKRAGRKPCIDTQDIIGKKFGKLTVLEYTGKTKHGHHNYLCQCECGQKKIVDRWSLLDGMTKSCGCLRRDVAGRMRIDTQDIIGKKFGKLTVLEYTGKNKNNRPTYLCQCECGQMKVIDRYSLLDGLTKSCGCLQKKKTDLDLPAQKPEMKRPTTFPYDIIGTQEGGLICLDCLHQREDRNWIYLVRCEKCGHEFELDRGNFLLGRTPCPNCHHGLEIKPKSKGQIKTDPSDIVGKRFGKLTVLEYAGMDETSHHLYRCQCDCGNEKVVNRTCLTGGRTKSCGCLRKEKRKTFSYEKPKIQP